MKNDIKIRKLIKHLSLKYKMNMGDIEKIVNSPYEFTKMKMKELELSKKETQEEFDNEKSIFMYRNLGKLYPTYRLRIKSDKQKNNINKINEDKWKK